MHVSSWRPGNLCNNFTLVAHFEYSWSIILGERTVSSVADRKRVGHATDPIFFKLSYYTDIKMVHTNVFKSFTNLKARHKKKSYPVFVAKIWHPF